MTSCKTSCIDLNPVAMTTREQLGARVRYARQYNTIHLLVISHCNGGGCVDGYWFFRIGSYLSRYSGKPLILHDAFALFFL